MQALGRSDWLAFEMPRKDRQRRQPTGADPKNVPTFTLERLLILTFSLQGAVLVMYMYLFSPAPASAALIEGSSYRFLAGAMNEIERLGLRSGAQAQPHAQ